MPDEPTAADVMSDGVIAIEQDASIQEAARRMREEGVRSLVVIEDNEAVGIVVGRDIVYQVDSEGRNASEVTVEEIMTSDLVTAADHDNVGDIAREMLRHDISRVPVLRGEQVVGIVTQSNILQAWPAYIELLQEEDRLYPFENTVHQEEGTEGECEQCENYSDALVNVDGQFLCPDCRAAL